jgi:sigma-B regulation protein RsbU (phosphoserine phosphatase)
LKILVVDDSAVMRTAMSRTIVPLGHPCQTATDGLEAWDLMQTVAIDVLITDWVMPELDGLELCRRIRDATAKTHYVYIMLMTSFQKEQDFLKAMAAGADDFLRKPVDPLELQGRLLAAERVTELHRELRQRERELERALGG